MTDLEVPVLTGRPERAPIVVVADSVEYAHMYADEKVGDEQLASARKVAQITQTATSGQVRVVMVDDYNAPVEWDPMDVAFELNHVGAKPDHIFGEADFEDHARILLSALEGPVKKRQDRWVRKHGGKLTCSLLTAAWYLVRLGAMPSPPDRLNGRKVRPAYRLVNVLPRIYQEAEKEARAILAASPWAWALDRIEYRWIDTVAEWEHFKARAYLEDNYADPHPSDLRLAKLLRQSWHQIGEVERAIEIGCGPNLYPVLAALPYTPTIDVTDYSQANVEYLRKAIADFDERWLAFGALPGSRSDAGMLLDLRAHAWRASVYDLPEASWDVASMHFVAESITSKPGDFQRALESIHQALRPSGHLLASFMLGSEGYTVAGAHFPAVPLDMDDVLSALKLAGFLMIHRVEKVGVGDEPVRPGYDGMLFVHARRTP